MIKVLLADDHEMVRAGLRSILAGQTDMQIVGEAGNGCTAVRLAREQSPDVVVMDISMPDLNGIDATRQIRAACPDVQVVILSMHSDRQYVSEALKAGAGGYILKERATAELIQAIHAVGAGRTFLSPRAAEAIAADPPTG